MRIVHVSAGDIAHALYSCTLRPDRLLISHTARLPSDKTYRSRALAGYVLFQMVDLFTWQIVLVE